MATALLMDSGMVVVEVADPRQVDLRLLCPISILVPAVPLSREKEGEKVGQVVVTVTERDPSGPSLTPSHSPA